MVVLGTTWRCQWEGSCERRILKQLSFRFLCARGRSAKAGRRPPVIFHSDDGNAVVAAPDDVIVVEQQMPVHGALPVLQAADVGQTVEGRFPAEILRVVVVAHDGDDAVFGFQLPKNRFEFVDFLRMVVHEVAGEDDEVGALRVDAVDDVADHLWLSVQGADMEVRQLDDAVAVEGWGMRRSV